MTPYDLVVTPTGVRFLGQKFPYTYGKGGISASKVEGDGATPRGIHDIVGAMYRPDRIAKPTPWAVPIKPTDLWCDDTKSPDYNHLVRKPFEASHEVLSRADPMYDLVVITNWNWPVAQKHKGSAIFIHAWRRPHAPTAGCIAFAPNDLLWIVKRLTPQSRLIVR